MGMSSYTFHMYRCQDEQVHFNNIDIFSHSLFAILLEGISQIHGISFHVVCEKIFIFKTTPVWHISSITA
jgi:hypothetical protein